jgi:hypothetical protein
VETTPNKLANEFADVVAGWRSWAMPKPYVLKSVDVTPLTAVKPVVLAGAR